MSYSPLHKIGPTEPNNKVKLEFRRINRETRKLRCKCAKRRAYGSEPRSKPFWNKRGPGSEDAILKLLVKINVEPWPLVQ